MLTPTAASAAYYGSETDYAVASSGPTVPYSCNYWYGADVCFKADGDLIYVFDPTVDGKSAVAHWHYGSYARWGSCVNKLGGGKWGICNKNFAEGTTVYFQSAVYDNGNWVDTEDYWMKKTA